MYVTTKLTCILLVGGKNSAAVAWTRGRQLSNSAHLEQYHTLQHIRFSLQLSNL